MNYQGDVGEQIHTEWDRPALVTARGAMLRYRHKQAKEELIFVLSSDGSIYSPWRHGFWAQVREDVIVAGGCGEV